MNCNQLEELKLGLEPPNLFHEDIFVNAGFLPNITIPSQIGWKNYVPQCTVDPESKHYIWYSFDTGLIKPDDEIPSCSECPTFTACPEITQQPALISCPEAPPCTECPKCPETTNQPVISPYPETTNQPALFSCPVCPEAPTCREVTNQPVIMSCSECPRCSECLCSDPIVIVQSQTNSGDYTSSFTLEMTQSYILRKSVSFSMEAIESNVFIETFIGGRFTIAASKSILYYMAPYLIKFYSMTGSQTLVKLDVLNKKKKLTPEMLIGLSCGSAAIFFIILALIIMYCRQLKNTNSDDLYLVSDSEEEQMMKAKHVDQGEARSNDNNVDPQGADESENTLGFWI